MTSTYNYVWLFTDWVARADYGYIYYRVFIKENIHILCESMAVTAIAEEIIKGLIPIVFEHSQV